MEIETVNISDIKFASADGDAVCGIEKCLRSGGELKPVVIDSDGILISGSRRISAAKRIGIETIGVIRFETLPKSVRRNGIKDVICSKCGNEWHVRKDTSPKGCIKCTSLERDPKKKESKRRVAPFVHCPICDRSFKKRVGEIHCSIPCRRIANSVDRSCKNCSESFKVYKSRMSGKTNATGSFCCRACYDSWMCKSGRTTGRGSRWNAIRREILMEHPFCAVCAKDSRIQVHHIVPFRLTHNNDPSNLIPLCLKHHKIVEYETLEIENSGASVDLLFSIMSDSLRSQSRKSRIIYERGVSLGEAKCGVR